MAKYSTDITIGQVAAHSSFEDAWIVVDGRVFNITKFANSHPGGKLIFADVLGKDATEQFFSFHETRQLDKYARLVVGEIQGFRQESLQKRGFDFIWVPNKVTGLDGEERDKLRAEQGGYYGMNLNNRAITQEELMKHPLLSKAPYGEIAATKQYYVSPYYKPYHLRFRLACREFFDSIRDEAEQAEKMNSHPTEEMFRRMGREGILACEIGVMALPYIKKFGIPVPGNLDIDKGEYDYFCELIFHEEASRLGCPGYHDGLFAGYGIGLPPIINFYEGADKDEVIKSIILGEKRVVLAITGPEAGSDVANMTCQGTKSADGTHYLVRGLKKWITGGVMADYFVTAVRTGSPNSAHKGISMMLIERSDEVTTDQMSTSYAKSACTALIKFEDAKVPVGRVFGKENEGFILIMLNFNHERWMIGANILGFMRLVVENCVLWLNQRMAFRKPLTEQPVLRFELGQAVSALESLQSYVDFVTYQMQARHERMHGADGGAGILMNDAMLKSYDAKSGDLDFQKNPKDYLAGEIGLMKYQITRTAHLVADISSQIFGGRGVTQTGMGRYVERFHRVYKIFAIYGGSEEIMADLGIRQALKDWDPSSKARAKL